MSVAHIQGQQDDASNQHYQISQTRGRLYRLEGLQMRHKPPRRRVTARLRDDRSHATGPNQVWAMDWMYDELFDGKRIWVLTVVDTWSQICPVMRVCRSATAMVVIEALDEARHTFGLPHTIRVDQGCQFTSKSSISGPNPRHHAGLLHAGQANGQCLCRKA